MKICIKCHKRESASWWDGLCIYCRKMPPDEVKAREYEKLNGSLNVLSPEQILISKTISSRNFWDWIKTIFSMLFLIFMIWWIYIQVQSRRGEPECPQGEYWVDDWRSGNSGCLR
jgi:hypothetical protein